MAASSFIDPQHAVDFARSTQLARPQPYDDGTRIRTLNGKGAETTKSNQLVDRFIQDAAQKNSHTLDVGAAYGWAAMNALEQGAVDYTLLDLSYEQLCIAAHDIADRDPAYLEKIKLLHGSFPYATRDIANESYNVIMLGRVLHFMEPQQIEDAAQEINRLMMPGGQAHVIVATAYMHGFNPALEIIEERKKSGHASPGWIENQYDVLRPELLNKYAGELEGGYHFLDQELLEHLFAKTGFETSLCQYAPLSYDSPDWKGRDVYKDKDNILAIFKKLN